MRVIKLIIILILFSHSSVSVAQDLPENVSIAFKSDDSVHLAIFLIGRDVNSCYGYYSLLSEAIRNHSTRCFSLLLKKDLDVNKCCNGYLPPLMHACKYGTVEMVKALIKKGANPNYIYEGLTSFTNGPQSGDTPLKYALRYGQNEIADYLLSLNQK